MAEKLCELKKKGSGGGTQNPTLLWTNPNMGSGATFTAQKIALNLNDYIGVIIYGQGGSPSSPSGDTANGKSYVPKGASDQYCHLTINSSYSGGRKVTVDNTGVTFGTGSIAGSENVAYNTYIPTYIYGIK